MSPPSQAARQLFFVVANFVIFHKAETKCLHAPWREGIRYSAGTYVQFHDFHYKCVAGHVAQKGLNLTPEQHPELWTRIEFCKDTPPKPVHAPRDGRCATKWASGKTYEAGAVRSFEHHNWICILQHFATPELSYTLNPKAARTLWTLLDRCH